MKKVQWRKWRKFKGGLMMTELIERVDENGKKRVDENGKKHISESPVYMTRFEDDDFSRILKLFLKVFNEKEG